MSLRLGINSIIAISNSIEQRNVDKLLLSDNIITDYGMHAIHKILQPRTTKGAGLVQLSLASCMISGEGIEYFLDELIGHKIVMNLLLKYGSTGSIET